MESKTPTPPSAELQSADVKWEARHEQDAVNKDTAPPHPGAPWGGPGSGTFALGPKVPSRFAERDGLAERDGFAEREERSGDFTHTLPSVVLHELLDLFEDCMGYSFDAARVIRQIGYHKDRLPTSLAPLLVVELSKRLHPARQSEFLRLGKALVFLGHHRHERFVARAIA